MWIWGTEKILWGEFYTKSFITKNKGFVPIVIFNFITGSSKEMGGGATHWTLLCCTVHVQYIVHVLQSKVEYFTHQNQGKVKDKCKYPLFLSFKFGMLTRPLFLFSLCIPCNIRGNYFRDPLFDSFVQERELLWEVWRPINRANLLLPANSIRSQTSALQHNQGNKSIQLFVFEKSLLMIKS